MVNAVLLFASTIATGVAFIAALVMIIWGGVKLWDAADRHDWLAFVLVAAAGLVVCWLVGALVLALTGGVAHG